LFTVTLGKLKVGVVVRVAVGVIAGVKVWVGMVVAVVVNVPVGIDVSVGGTSVGERGTAVVVAC
jgi:hypothetical protein